MSPTAIGHELTKDTIVIFEEILPHVDLAHGRQEVLST